MGEAFLVRRGGSGLPAHFAVLHVTAPTGSTLTLEKNGAALAVLAPGRGHPNAADNAVSEWHYPVGPARFGVWTVTAVKNSDSASKSVEIDSVLQYDLSVHHRFYLIRDGVIQNSLTETFGSFSGATGTAVYDSAAGTRRVRLYKSVSYGPIPAGQSQRYLVLEYGKVETNNGYDAACGIGSAATGYDGWSTGSSTPAGPYAAYHKFELNGNGLTEAGSVSVDLANVDSETRYAVFSAVSNGSCYFTIKNLYLTNEAPT